MFKYDLVGMKNLLWDVIVQNTTPDTQAWLQKMGDTQNGAGNFNTAFIIAPRKTGKDIVRVSDEQILKFAPIIYDFSIEGWTVDKLSRVWLLLQLDASDKDKYFRTIENLFLSAEMNELVALYSALPLFAYPELWIKRCAEGIRSNIAGVLEVIMYHNPYPAAYLEEPAWNQMVLKAFFTDKQVQLITGAGVRINQKLAYTLTDYARERWAAGRKVDPMLWSFVGEFIDDNIFESLKIGLGNNDRLEIKFMALAIAKSNHQPAKDYLKQNFTFSEGHLKFADFISKNK